MMKKIYFVLIASLLLVGCVSRPKNFTYGYKNENTGLDKLIDLNGYYVSQRECDTAFFTMYMFYPNGLFTIATTSRILPELADCFAQGGKSAICRYPLWGTYRVEGDLIKAQAIRLEGNGCVVFYTYRIQPDGSIVNVSDYVEPQHTNLGDMANYPSFIQNKCETPARFYPLTDKRDSMQCPLLKKKWFCER